MPDFLYQYPSKKWGPILSPLMTLGVIFAIISLNQTAYRIPNPPAILVAFITFFSFAYGLVPGLISALISWVYIAYTSSIPGVPFHFDAINLHRVVIWAMVLPLISLMTGLLKKRSDFLIERELSVNREWFSITLKSIGDGVIATNKDGKIVFLNTVAEILTGWSQVDAIGKSLEEVFRIVNAVTKEDIENPVRKVLKQGVVVGLANHTMLISKSGKEIPIDDSGAPIRDKKGAIIGIVLVFHDITQREETEQRLLSSKKQYEDLVNSVEGVVWEADANSLKFHFISPQVKRMLGFSKEEWLKDGDFWVNHIHPEDREDVIHCCREVISQLKPMEVEYRLLNSKKQIIWIRDILSVVGEKGQAQHLQGILRDFSTMKQIEIDLHEKVERLELLKNIFQSFQHSLDLPGVYQRIYELFPQYLNVHRVSLLLYDEKLDALISDNLIGVTRTGEQLISAPQALGHSISGVCFKQKVPIIIDDCSKTDLIPQEMIEVLQLKSTIAIPIFSKQRVLGVLRLDDTEKTFRFSEKDIEFYQMITEQLGIIIDNAMLLTQQKQFEGQLLQSEQRYRQLFDLSPDAIIVHMDGKIILINAAGVKLLGASSTEELIGKPVMSLVHPDYIAVVGQRIQDMVIQGKTVPLIEEKFIRVDGTSIDVEVVASSFLYQNQQAIQVVCRDITQRKKEEQELTESVSLLKATLESTTDGILVVDNTGKILSYNNKFVELWNIPNDLLTARDDDKALGFVINQLKNPEEFITKVKELYSQPEAESFDILEFKDGRIFERYSIPQLVGGKSVGRVWSFRDVSDRKKLEQQLWQSQKMEVVGTLAGGVAHDFNNLLTTIIGNAEIALSKLEIDPIIEESLKDIYKAAERASELTRQLLLFSRKTMPEFQNWDLHEVIEDSLRILKRTLGSRIEINFQKNAQDSILFSDPVQIQQVIMNLAINARDAMPDGGLLTLTTENLIIDDDYCELHSYAKPGYFLRLAVTDTGIGMDTEVQRRIFEPFFTTKDIGQGTGLGLAVVYGVIKSHNGWINVYSELGRGSSFKIYFPVEKMESLQTPIDTKDLVYPSGTETILLVDDDALVLKFGKLILEKLGYHVLTTDRAEEGIQFYGNPETSIDLVITDLIMPEMDGREFIKRIRKMNPQSKIILCSGANLPRDGMPYVSENIDGFVVKPFHITQLSAVVRAVLDKGVK